MEKYRLIQEQKPEELSSASSAQQPQPQPQPPCNVQDGAGGSVRRKPSTDTPSRHHTSDTVTTSSTISTEYPEVRITQQGKPRNYISYAMNLLVRRNSVDLSSTSFPVNILFSLSFTCLFFVCTIITPRLTQ